MCHGADFIFCIILFIKKHGYLLQNISNLMQLSLFISWTFLCEKLRNLIELKYEVINLVQQNIVNCTLGVSLQDSVVASVLFPVDMGRAIKVSVFASPKPLQSRLLVTNLPTFGIRCGPLLEHNQKFKELCMWEIVPLCTVLMRTVHHGGSHASVRGKPHLSDTPDALCAYAPCASEYYPCI